MSWFLGGSVNNNSKSSIPPDQLPDFFPRAPKECSLVSQQFFTCFHENTEKISNDDTEAGVRGLAKCLNEKTAYEKCMLNLEKKSAPKKYYRVSRFMQMEYDIILYEDGQIF